MSIEILQGNLFDKKSDALILTLDGARAGLEGNITRAFARAYPDAWEELEYMIQYPIRLGTSKMYPIASDIDCPFRYAIFASTLHHVESLTDQQKLEVMKAALSSSLSLAMSKLLGSISCGLMTGGWRISHEQALMAMIDTYECCVKGRESKPRLQIYVLGEKEFMTIGDFLSSHYPQAIASNSGYLININ